jgi:hypothetical protein
LTVLRRILDHRFRANPAFGLMALDELPERYRPDLADAVTTSGPAVALVPRSAGNVTVKILNGVAAELVRALKVLDCLPADVTRGGQATNEAIARLVLDGALEIEDGDRLTSGPDAHATIFHRSATTPSAGRLVSLSLRAIRYGQSLMIRDVEMLSRRLYSFGTIPRSSRWDLLTDSAGEVNDLLGLSRGGRVWRVLSGDYQALTLSNWLSWSRDAAHVKRGADLRFKLYVSPHPQALIECFPRLATVLAEKGVRSFKVGRGVSGLLRPDKFVAYFDRYEHLQQVARALAGQLEGYPSHGVPFTAEASSDGLLSWGIDPSPHERLLASRPEESWRYWVTNRLASGLVHAQSVGNSVEPWEFAMDRLSLEGVDTTTWLPIDMTARTPDVS